MVPYSSGSSFRGNKWSQKNNQPPKVTVFDPTGGLRESFSKPGSRGGDSIEQINFGSGAGVSKAVGGANMRAQTSPGTTRGANNYSIISNNTKKGDSVGMFEKFPQHS